MTARRTSIERLNLTFGLGAAAGAAAVAGPTFALSVALGTALELVNFRALYQASLILFSGQLTTAGKWLVVFGLRLVLLAIAMGVALRSGAHPVGLLLGLSSVVPAVLVQAWRSRPPVLDHPPLAALSPEDSSWDDYSVWRPLGVSREADDE